MRFLCRDFPESSRKALEAVVNLRFASVHRRILNVHIAQHIDKPPLCREPKLDVGVSRVRVIFDGIPGTYDYAVPLRNKIQLPSALNKAASAYDVLKEIAVEIFRCDYVVLIPVRYSAASYRYKVGLVASTLIKHMVSDFCHLLHCLHSVTVYRAHGLGTTYFSV